MRSIVLAAVFSLMGVAAHAAPTLVDFATVSMSAPGVPRTVTNTVCVTDGNDLACDRGVYITSESRVGIGTASPLGRLHVSDSSTGRFYFDGLSGAGSAIILRGARSGPSSVQKDDTIGAIGARPFNGSDFSTGSSAGIFFKAASNNSVSDLGSYIVLTTTPISGTVTQERMTITEAGRVGVGTTIPSATLDVFGTTQLSTRLMGRAYQGDHFWIGLGPNGAEPKNLAIGIVPSASDTTVVESIKLGADGNVAMIITSQSAGILTINPKASLETRGTFRLASGGEDCDANRTGAIRYTGGDFSFCRNGTAWETLTSLGGGGGVTDRITSGTSAVVVNSATGIVSITQLGAVTSYVHPSMGYVGPGVSTTGTISGSNGYFNGKVGIGTVAPVVPLHVSGSALITQSISSAGPVWSTQMAINGDSDDTNDVTTTNNVARINFGTGNAQRSQIEGGRDVSGGYDGYIAFRTRYNPAAPYIHERMRITGPGLVGIGTSAPNAKLDVSGTVSSTAVYLARTANQCLTAADEGLMFRNATTRKLQVCVIRY